MRTAGRRESARALLRLALPLAYRVEVSGACPATGPYILAGNHSGFIEVALMVAWGPRGLELLGSGDVPLEPRFAKIAAWYGFIPVNRGNLDRAALAACMDALGKGGALGIFPEGGIWEERESAAQKGVSWLAMKAGVPVVPVSFGGLSEAARARRTFRRPRLTVRFGEPLPPPPPGSGREALDAHAALVMAAIRGGVPPEFRAVLARPVEERFGLRVESGSAVREPPHGDALARLLFAPVLVRTFARNLGLRVEALARPDQRASGRDFALAASEILRYLREVNRHFFDYRFGPEIGARVKAALEELEALGNEAGDATIALHAERRWRMAVGDAESREWLPPGNTGGVPGAARRGP